MNPFGIVCRHHLICLSHLLLIQSAFPNACHYEDHLSFVHVLPDVSMALFLVAFLRSGSAPPRDAPPEPRGLGPAEYLASQVTLLLAPHRYYTPEGENRALHLMAAVIAKGLESLLLHLSLLDVGKDGPEGFL